MKTMAPAYFTALGTQSSAATIPVTLRQARKTGASDKVTDLQFHFLQQFTCQEVRSHLYPVQ